MGYWADSFQDVGQPVSYNVNLIEGSLNQKDIINISSDYYVPSKGDSIYFLPKVNIPRVKFRLFCEANLVKNVRDVSNANIIIGSNSSINEMVSESYEYLIKTEKLREFMQLPDAQKYIDEKSIESIRTALEFYTEEQVFVDRATSRIVYGYLNIDESVTARVFYSISEEYTDIYDDVKSSKIYSENSIIDQINGDNAAVINVDMYEQLKTMFASSDDDNSVLAMEIMANCKYSESLPYLALLFYEYGSNMSSMSCKNHVNFKSLLTWMHISNRNMHYLSRDWIMQLLAEKNKLTVDTANIIISNLKDQICNAGDTEVFKVKTITLDPKYLEILNSNYTFNTVSDYVPTVIAQDPDDDDDEDGDVLTIEIEEAEEVYELVDETIVDELISIEDTVDNIELNTLESNKTQTNITHDTNNFDWF